MNKKIVFLSLLAVVAIIVFAFVPKLKHRNATEKEKTKQ